MENRKQRRHPSAKVPPSAPEKSVAGASPSPSKNGLATLATSATVSHSGPLPHPSVLQGYEAIKSGFAERIVQMAEGEAVHRHRQEEKALDADIESTRKEFLERRIGQVFAFSIVLIMASMGIYLALHGHEIAGSVFGGPAIVAIVGAFLSKKKETDHPS